MQTFFTLDNGSAPFKVVIYDGETETGDDTPDVMENKRIDILKKSSEENSPSFTCVAKRIFVGKSHDNKMTRFSGGSGSSFDGNSFLFELDNDTYVHAGRTIFSFKPLAKITTYVSSVGNGCVPYPYAIDEKHNYYLMIENVILLNKNRDQIENFLLDGSDPYDYYYRYNVMSSANQYTEKPMINYRNITGFYTPKDESNSGELEQYNLRYHNDSPFNREWYFPIKREYCYIKQEGSDDLIPINRDEYWAMIHEFGDLAGFDTMHTTIICNRHDECWLEK